MSQEAAKHHRQAAEHHEHAAKHHLTAAEHHEAGNHEKAGHHAHLAHGHERLLEAHRDAGRAERHLRTYLGQEAEGNEPSLAQAHWKLGQALHLEGRDSAAIGEWRESLRLDPESPASRDLKSIHGSRSAVTGSN